MDQLARGPRRTPRPRPATIAALATVALLGAVLVPTVAGARDTTPPTAPSNIVVTSATGSTLALAWSRSTDNVGVTRYRVYRNGNRVGTTGVAAFTLTGLRCGTRYTVGVEAYDAAGNRSKRTSASVATLACPDTRPPTTPTEVAVAERTTSAITLRWRASTDNVGVLRYDLYRDGALAGSTAQTSYAFTGLSCGTASTLAVRAADAAGNQSAAASTLAATGTCSETPPPPSPGDSQAPSTPSGVAVDGAAATELRVRWNASTDDVAVAGYDVSLGGAVVGTTSAPGYVFRALTCGSTYSFGVRAYDAAGNRSGWTSASAATSACPDVQAPSAPVGLAQSAASDTTAGLAWQPSSDDVGVAGYGIYLGTALVASTSATSFVLTGLACGSAHGVAVDAVDAGQNRSPRTSFTVTTAACPQAGAITANVWLAPNGNDTSCTRSPAKVAAGQLQACATWQRACQVATGGDEVGVLAGDWAAPLYEWYITSDCSDGAGADDPVGRSGWVTFKCGSGEQRDSVRSHAGAFVIRANAHVHVKGRCFYLHWLRLGLSDDMTRTTQNVVIEGVHLDGSNIRAARNFHAYDVEVGPAVLCARWGHPSRPASQQCNPSGPAFEAQYAHRVSGPDGGSANMEGLTYFPWIGRNLGGLISENIVVDGAWVHDGQTKDDVSWHMGCARMLDNTNLPFPPTDNVVVRRLVCERTAVYGFYLENSGGITIENSWFGCPTSPMNHVGGSWGDCAPNQPTIQTRTHPSGRMENILFRHNSVNASISLMNATFANVRFVGNIAKGTSCNPGVVWDYNAWMGPSACGANSRTAVGDPWVSSGYGTTWTTAPVMSLMLGSGAKTFEHWIPAAGHDFALATDYLRNARTSPTTAGSHER